MLARNLQSLRGNGKLTVRKPPRYFLGRWLKRRRWRRAAVSALALLFGAALTAPIYAQADPASEPTVLAVAKVLPAVVNINTERVVRRRVRDPFEDFASQYFGNYRSRPREIRQTLQSLGSGFLVDPAGYIITNQHVVERAADLKIEVTLSDGKTVNARYITGDEKKDLAFIKIDSKEPLPFIDLNNLSPNLLGQTVIVVGNALGYSSSISRGVLSGMKRDIKIEEVEYKNLLQTDAAINPGKQRRAVNRSLRATWSASAPRRWPSPHRVCPRRASALPFLPRRCAIRSRSLSESRKTSRPRKLLPLRTRLPLRMPSASSVFKSRS